MADINKGKTFSPSEEVTNVKLHELVDNATVSNISSSDLATNAVTEEKINAGSVTASKIGNDAINGSKIEDDSIDSEHYVDGSIDLAHLASGIKSGSDVTLITGTAGTDGYLSKWNADGDLVDGYALINDDTMATASDTNIPSADSVVNYVASEIASNPSIEEGSWTDYSSTSTITGWSSFTTKELYYKTIGDNVFVQFTLSGTSNLNAITFTLPDTSSNTIDIVSSLGYHVDGGSAAQGGTIWMPKNGTTVRCTTGALSTTTWTDSSTKTVFGQFWYVKA